jgi:hypothetical protein
MRDSVGNPQHLLVWNDRRWKVYCGYQIAVLKRLVDHVPLECKITCKVCEEKMAQLSVFWKCSNAEVYDPEKEANDD